MAPVWSPSGLPPDARLRVGRVSGRAGVRSRDEGTVNAVATLPALRPRAAGARGWCDGGSTRDGWLSGDGSWTQVGPAAVNRRSPAGWSAGEPAWFAPSDNSKTTPVANAPANNRKVAAPSRRRSKACTSRRRTGPSIGVGITTSPTISTRMRGFPNDFTGTTRALHKLPLSAFKLAARIGGLRRASATSPDQNWGCQVKYLIGTLAALSLVAACLTSAAVADMQAGHGAGPGMRFGAGTSGRANTGDRNFPSGHNPGGGNHQSGDDHRCDPMGGPDQMRGDCGKCRDDRDDCECPPGSMGGPYCECPPGSMGGPYCECPPGSRGGDQCGCQPQSHQDHGCGGDHHRRRDPARGIWREPRHGFGGWPWFGFAPGEPFRLAGGP